MQLSSLHVLVERPAEANDLSHEKRNPFLFEPLQVSHRWILQKQRPTCNRSWGKSVSQTKRAISLVVVHSANGLPGSFLGSNML